MDDGITALRDIADTLEREMPLVEELGTASAGLLSVVESRGVRGHIDLMLMPEVADAITRLRKALEAIAGRV